MKKSEFLQNLATAHSRFIAGIKPYPGGKRGVGHPAALHADDLGIWHMDLNHMRDEDNPVVKAILWFAQREVTRSSPIEDQEMLEDAWEYFQRMSEPRELQY